MKRWLLILVPILALAAMIVWRVNTKNAAVAGMAGQRASRMKGPAVVVLAPVRVRDLTRTFEATGSVEAPLSVNIAPKLTGRIESVTAREGDRVHKGQVLVRIDASEVEANVRQEAAALAETQYRLAQAEMGRNPIDVSVNTQIRQQIAALKSAEADYNQALETLKAQIAAAAANVADAQSKIDNAMAAVNSAQSNLENSKARYNRAQNLLQKGFVATQQVEDAKAAVSVQESALTIAQGQVNSATALKEAAQQQLLVVKSKGNADIEAARARKAQAEASLEYAQANTAQKSAYGQSISALQAGVAAAQASLRSAQARRQDTVLVSPLDGYVSGRYTDPGAIASPSQPILSVQFSRQVWVTASVPEEVCAKMRIGQPTTIKLDAFPDKSLSAKVVQINPSADPQSRLFTVRVILDNTDNLFKPGMFARVVIETQRIHDALVVPREALEQDSDGSYVMAVDSDQKAKRVPVVPGVEDEAFVSIGHALPPGSKVVTMSAMPVREGQSLDTRGRKGKDATRPGHRSRGGSQQ